MKERRSWRWLGLALALLAALVVVAGCGTTDSSDDKSSTSADSSSSDSAGNGKKVKMVTTDGHRLSYMEQELASQQEDVQAVVDGMKSARDYSDDESMKEIVARIEAASGATPTKEGE